MNKFTPGVWREHHSSAPDWESTWHINSGSQMIVMGEGWSEQQQANARLIAKAPEMYDILKVCKDRVYGKGLSNQDLSLEKEIEKLLEVIDE